MKEHVNTLYECEICHIKYRERQDAIECESFTVSECKYKIGDTVEFLHTDKKGKVTGYQVDVNKKLKQHYISIIYVDHTLAIGMENIKKCKVQ